MSTEKIYFVIFEFFSVNVTKIIDFTLREIKDFYRVNKIRLIEIDSFLLYFKSEEK